MVCSGAEIAVKLWPVPTIFTVVPLGAGPLDGGHDRGGVRRLLDAASGRADSSPDQLRHSFTARS